MSEKRKGDEGIVVYLRVRKDAVRPTKKPSKFYDVSEATDRNSVIQWDIPVEQREGVTNDVNNTRTKYNFKFNAVLPMDISQEQVFDRIGRDVVLNALGGYNSTIFAYGQTGSGKTFTITGGSERYEDRGIIPRAIALIFKAFRDRSDAKWTAHISYMEIYNEQGFDLLDERHETKALADLPRVKMMEDEHGNFHLRNLSMHRAESEEDALNLLFLGDTNRAISATAMNQASSRSHCIFTVFIEGRRVGSDVVLRSKLHLVDLAGSERTHKTKSDGQTLREAQYINTSLFFLEMVIVALNEKSKAARSHIPYRNSMMTSVLRDSLGGNCKTAMIATVSAEREQTDESISTCRFAQRVALVKNEARVNEETDPTVTIARLKGEVSTLKAEVHFLKGESGEGTSLTDGERAELRDACERYVEARDPAEALQVAPLTLVRIRDCFAILKNMVLVAASGVANAAASSVSAASQNNNNPALDAAGDLARLKKLLKERDNEIAILVNMVRQAKGGKPIPPLAMGASLAKPRRAAADENNNNNNDDDARSSVSEESRRRNPTPDAKRAGGSPRRGGAPKPRAAAKPPRVVAGVSCLVEGAVRDDPQQAYSYFRDRSKANEALEANKLLLKDRFAAAKALGLAVNESRISISYLKKTIEQLRRERAIDGLSSPSAGDGEEAEPSPEEAKHKEAIEVEKEVYKESFEKLRVAKGEIENIQRMLEAGRSRLQADFDAWYDMVLRTPAQRSDATHEAWATPPVSEPKSSRRAPSTGNNADAEDDIQAFYRAKEELAQMQAKR